MMEPQSQQIQGEPTQQTDAGMQGAGQPTGGVQSGGQQTGGMQGGQQMGGGARPMTQPPQQIGSQSQQMGQQPQQMGQPHQMSQQMGLALSDVETPQQRAAVDNIARAIQVCGWCADQCIQLGDPSMSACIQYCEDVAELGEAALALIPRSSPYTEAILQTFQQAAQACAQECGAHHHAHCQECAQVLPQTVQSIQQLSGGGQGGIQGSGGQMGSQQGGGQPVGGQQGGPQLTDL